MTELLELISFVAIMSVLFTGIGAFLWTMLFIWEKALSRLFRHFRVSLQLLEWLRYRKEFKEWKRRIKI